MTKIFKKTRKIEKKQQKQNQKQFFVKKLGKKHKIDNNEQKISKRETTAKLENCARQ